LTDSGRKRRAMIVKKVLDASGLTRAQVARDSGLNEATIWGWLNGRSVPTPESLRKLASGLEKRGGDLQNLARELREEAGE